MESIASAGRLQWQLVKSAARAFGQPSDFIEVRLRLRTWKRVPGRPCVEVFVGEEGASHPVFAYGDTVEDAARKLRIELIGRARRGRKQHGRQRLRKTP
jgi:hypothetical protein